MSHAMVRPDFPGPQARELLSRLQRHFTPAIARRTPFVYESASGAILVDVDGNRFIDMTSGVGIVNVGHCHPRVTEAIGRQARELTQAYCGFGYRSLADLSERIAAIAPGDLSVSLFMNSGAEVIEAAVKLTRRVTGRHHIVSFEWGLHGRTYAATHLTGFNVNRRIGYEPLVPGIVHTPSGYCYRCSLGHTFPECHLACLRFLEETVFGRLIPPQDTAAILIEPIQGEGGYVVPPEGWMQRLREIASRHGILLVADECHSALARTGKMFAVEHWDVVPDILLLSGGLGILPLSALVSTPSLMEKWGFGAHGTTMGGNPVSCAAATVAIDVIQEEGLVEKAAVDGRYLKSRLESLAGRHPLIGDVRGLGLMIGVELVKNRETKEAAGDASSEVIAEALRMGVLFTKAATSTVKFCPPLTITRPQLDECCTIFDEALSRVEGRLGLVAA